MISILEIKQCKTFCMRPTKFSTTWFLVKFIVKPNCLVLWFLSFIKSNSTFLRPLLKMKNENPTTASIALFKRIWDQSFWFGIIYQRSQLHLWQVYNNLEQSTSWYLDQTFTYESCTWKEENLHAEICKLHSKFKQECGEKALFISGFIAHC